jgi:curved DNA-binding protein CbpA
MWVEGLFPSSFTPSEWVREAVNTSKKVEGTNMNRINYFKHVNGRDEIRKKYLELCKKFHPDLGGDAETMKVINNQYEQLEDSYFQNARYEKEEKRRAGDTSYTETRSFDTEAFESILTQLFRLNLPLTVSIEICGAWLWVSGDTKPFKEQFKEVGLRFGGTKKAWYWYPEGYQPKHKGSKGNLDSIRDKYGSHRVNKQGNKGLNEAI